MILGLATMVMTLACGCHKAKKAVTQVPADQNTNQTVADQPPVYQQPPTAASAAPANATAQAAGPDLRELDRGLIRWIVSNRRRPSNFEEFAATANITIPPPPSGKKYIFDQTMHIQLVDR